MENPIVPINPGVMLKEDYMDYLNLDSVSIAKKIGVEPIVIQDLIAGRIRMDKELSWRLGKLMKIDRDYWMRIQNECDLETEESEINLRNAVTKAGNSLTVEGLDRRRIILSAFCIGKVREKFDSIQSQSIMYFICKEVDTGTNSLCFNFERHLRSPVDHEFTNTIKEMEKEKLINIVDSARNWKNRKYVLNSFGRKIGESILSRMTEEARRGIREIVEWVMKLDFNELKEITYGKYSDMIPSKY